MLDIAKFHKPVPRYTSYPTAPEWGPLPEGAYEKHLELLGQSDVPLSLYFHIPFCKTMCLYCACSVVLNRKEENEIRYVDYLIAEIDAVVEKIGKKRKVPQLHFGGGTPTKLSMPLFKRLFLHIQEAFDIDFSKEIAIEIDPRTVMEEGGAKLKFLRELGFNRASFGVQDTNLQVQAAVKRHQTYEMTKATYELARKLAFEGVNIDLIYGLPYQTRATFKETIQKITKMRPNRIALFSYAKVPWLKPHQKALKEETLPSTEEKFAIYTEARETLIKEGYVAIGMDHFALEGDELAQSYHHKTLHRNFQGYTVRLAEDMLGFGASAIGYVRGGYFQNLKKLPAYYRALDQKKLPVERGKLLTKEDLYRKKVIHTLMCRFEYQKEPSFDTHFAAHHEEIQQLEKEGLIKNTPEKIIVTPLGELFVRNVAAAFDAYLVNKSSEGRFSKSI